MKSVKKFYYMLAGLLFTLTTAIAGEKQTEQAKSASRQMANEGQWDFLIIAIAVVIVVITLVFSIKYLVKPGENSPDHIKNIVIDNY